MGHMLRNLSYDTLSLGSSGKFLIRLTHFGTYKSRSVSSFLKVGDLVLLSRGSEILEDCLSKLSIQGEVFKHDRNSLTLIVGGDWIQALELCEKDNLHFLIKTDSDVTYKKMFSAITKLEKLETSNKHNFLIVDILLNKIDKDELKLKMNVSKHYVNDYQFFKKNMNECQKDAICFALNNPVSIIHGLFACGKTTTIVEILEQINKMPSHEGKVMICGPSNVSVDTILERVAKNKRIDSSKVARIGNINRIQGNAEYGLDSKAQNNPIIKEMNSKINLALQSHNKANARSYNHGGSNLSSSDLKNFEKLLNELHKKEDEDKQAIIKKSKFLFDTLHSSSNGQVLSMYNKEDYEDLNEFHTVETLIIDEVSQSMEIQCWIPILDHLKYLKRIIFAGDNNQLSPTVKTFQYEKGAGKGVFDILNTTIFDRLEQAYGKTLIAMLNVQYRMNERIMQFPSDEVYDGAVISGDVNRNILLSDLNPGNYLPDKGGFLNEPVLWYDTQNSSKFMEDRNFESNSYKGDLGSSKSNINEVHIALQHIEKLMTIMRLKKEHIGIVTPYKGQVNLMKKHIHKKYPNIAVHTVDGYQGSEKECIIFSLVRFNKHNQLGFVKDKKRLNVAITRAKRQLCVIGNLETFSQSKESNDFLKNWCKFVDINGVIEYPTL